ncbi:MAG: hypothetical protein A3J38_02415 [Gammaproteobacteria bacterium RIFCSPHIGHO2_12_FULL_45_9]|nr:MAG: hypothetical protein A3J38_02415 [Gammaproteobacteria bacterium RIFCSPHIGHO2_12_FULL_45_9]
MIRKHSDDSSGTDTVFSTLTATSPLYERDTTAELSPNHPATTITQISPNDSPNTIRPRSADKRLALYTQTEESPLMAALGEIEEIQAALQTYMEKRVPQKTNTQLAHHLYDSLTALKKALTQHRQKPLPYYQSYFSPEQRHRYWLLAHAEDLVPTLEKMLHRGSRLAHLLEEPTIQQAFLALDAAFLNQQTPLMQQYNKLESLYNHATGYFCIPLRDVYYPFVCATNYSNVPIPEIINIIARLKERGDLYADYPRTPDQHLAQWLIDIGRFPTTICGVPALDCLDTPHSWEALSLLAERIGLSVNQIIPYNQTMLATILKFLGFFGTDEKPYLYSISRPEIPHRIELLIPIDHANMTLCHCTVPLSGQHIGTSTTPTPLTTIQIQMLSTAENPSPHVLFIKVHQDYELGPLFAQALAFSCGIPFFEAAAERIDAANTPEILDDFEAWDPPAFPLTLPHLEQPPISRRRFSHTFMSQSSLHTATDTRSTDSSAPTPLLSWPHTVTDTLLPDSALTPSLG